MIHSKNNNGFTLIEVLIALLIMGLLMGALFVSEGSIVRVVSNSSQRLRRILAAKKFMYTQQKEDKKEKQRADESLNEIGLKTHLVYESVPSKSAVLKDFKDIAVQKVTVEWQEGRRRTEELATLKFEPKEQKKKS